MLKTRKFENEQGVADAINKSEVDIGGIVQIGDCEYCIVGWSTDKDGKAIPPIQLGSPDQPVGGYGRLK